MFRVLVANRFSQDSLFQLGKGPIEFDMAPELSELKSVWPEAQGLLIRSGTRVTRELLAKLPRLEAIVTATSGFDHIDLKACAERKIAVMHTPEANAQSAAEHTWALILATQRRLNVAHTQMVQSRWERSALVGRELRGRTLGIIGFGHIGTRMAKIAKAFEMKVLVHDPYVEQDPTPEIEFFGFEEVVRKSDIITFHVPLTTETKQMVKTNTLDWFNEDATLINASRGDITCMSSLLNYLQENPDFTVGLDVFPAEPLPADSALFQFKNVYMTPHIGATTEEAIQRASQLAVQKMIAFAEKKIVTNPLPPATLWAEKLI